MSKPFLLLQLRPEDDTSDNEFAAFSKFGGIPEGKLRRVRMEQESIPSINLDEFSAVIVGGGPYNVSDDEATKPGEQKRFEAELTQLLKEIVTRDFPFLGGCYGLGLLARYLGAEVAAGRFTENVEAVTVSLTEQAAHDPLTQGLPQTFRAFTGHKEACQATPPGAVLLASSEKCPVHMIRYQQNIYAMQFHPEADKEGWEIRLRAYKYKGYFKPEDIDRLIEQVKQESVTVPEQILRRFVKRYGT